MKHRYIVLLMTGLEMGCVAGNAFGQTYNVELLGVVDSTANSYAQGVNNAGQIVGYRSTATGQVAVTWTAPHVGADLAFLPGGGKIGQANAINDNGEIVGFSSTSPGLYTTFHAALWSGGAVTDLGTLGNQSSIANGINNSEVIVGQTSNGDQYALIWKNRQIAYLAPAVPGKADGGAFGVNAMGQVVGYFWPQTYFNQAFWWHDGNAYNIGLEYPASKSYARAINSGTQIVGYSYFGGGVAHAALWSYDAHSGNITTTDLGALVGNDTPTSDAMAINNKGVTVGTSSVIGVNANAGRATLWVAGSPVDLNGFVAASDVLAGWHLYQATGVNDNLEIVGNAVNFTTSRYAAFRATVQVAVGSTTPTINPGQTATIVATPSDGGSVTYQWYQGASGNTSAPVAGATGVRFTTPPLSVTTSYWVRVVTPTGAVERSAAFVVTVADSNSSAVDAPIPLWALGALGAALLGIASRRYPRRSLSSSES